MKFRYIRSVAAGMLAGPVCLTMLPFYAAAQPIPSIAVEKTAFSPSETVYVEYKDTDTLDWIGLYPEGATPGSMDSLTWSYAEGEGRAAFDVKRFEAGEYAFYLCDNDGYAVLDMVRITLLDGDETDYGAQAASVTAVVENGKSQTSVTVTPGCDEALTYSLYWSVGETRLEGYRPLATVEHEGGEAFTVELNDGLFMPDEADGIEVAVKKGRSASVFAKAPESLKVPASAKLYEFQVITDMHISESAPQHTANLTAALNDIAALSPDSVAIVSVGDNTDRGTQAEYALLLETIDSVDADLPPMYYAMGNHDTVYSGTYEWQVGLFKKHLGMEAVYYAGQIGDTPFIVLGSDTQVGEGTMSPKQLEFLKTELAKTDKEKPVFVFLHQPLKDTVSGTLTTLDEEIQDWYGFIAQEEEIRAVLKDYPNAVVFSGHTHWSLEMTQPLLYGDGEDATFANAASVGYLWSDEDTAIGGSQGYYVEVYEDYILLRGREYQQGEWCAAAQFLIPLNGGSSAVFQANAANSDWTFYAVMSVAAVLIIACVITGVAVVQNHRRRSAE